VAAFFDYGATGDLGSESELIFLAQLRPTEWERIVGFMERRRYAAGEVVLARDEADRSLYLVAAGSVEVVAPDGRRERTLRVQGVGTILGEVAFFDGKPRSATVRAAVACELLRLSADAFEALAARHPDLGRAFLLDLGRILALRLRQAEARDGG
jgi:CRP/FNR family cyclic AMP-dependent transcriptional regulator